MAIDHSFIFVAQLNHAIYASIIHMKWEHQLKDVVTVCDSGWAHIKWVGKKCENMEKFLRFNLRIYGWNPHDSISWKWLKVKRKQEKHCITTSFFRLANRDLGWQ